MITGNPSRAYRPRTRPASVRAARYRQPHTGRLPLVAISFHSIKPALVIICLAFLLCFGLGQIMTWQITLAQKRLNALQVITADLRSTQEELIKERELLSSRDRIEIFAEKRFDLHPSTRAQRGVVRRVNY